MTIERRIAHSSFALAREYPVTIDKVWRAFADPDQKRQWTGDGDAFEPRAWEFDFRVGGRDIDEAKFHGGPTSRYEAVYTDIVKHHRIITTYDMWLDGIHMSTSVASFEFESVSSGTRMTHTEHGVFFDQFWTDGPQRERGTLGLHDALARHLLNSN